MALINSDVIPASATAYEIEQSLRFNDDDSAYLSWTPSSAGNRRTFTFSFWAKKGVGGYEVVLRANMGGGYEIINFNSNGSIRLFSNEDGNNYNCSTSNVYRDSSAWYHFVFAVDTTQATASNRVKIYANGVLQSLGTANYPTQNLDTNVNSTNEHQLSAEGSYDGYLSEVNFIDGQALDPTSFGETGDYGEWKPIKYSGTYGTNGFYLPFKQDYTVEGFSTTIYTGTGANQYIGGTGFQPDLIWYKRRNSAASHQLYDSIRGVGNTLFPDLTNAESYGGTRLTSFESDGFTLGSDGGGNASGDSYVAWSWDMGGSNASNTDGTITSTVRANPTYGQSIVSYTGNSTNGATVGHGLSSAPEIIIVKNRNDSTKNWGVYNSTIGATKWLKLNLNDSAQTDPIWANTAPTSSVFSLNSTLTANDSGDNIIAYCFHSVSGYSKIGSYTGTGSAGTPSVSLGFRPAFVIVKRTSGAGEWHMFDSVRNPDDNFSYLSAESSSAEVSWDKIDFTDTGFTIQGDSTNSSINKSGDTYIYMAFADKREFAYWLDQSGNNNDWTSNNLTESDISVDSPTNNFATLNPLNAIRSVGLSQGNLQYSSQSASGANAAIYASTIPFSSGKWYFEYRLRSGNVDIQGGIVALPATPINGSFENWRYKSNGNLEFNGGYTSGWASSYTTGDVIGIAVDADNGTFKAYKNNSLVGTKTGIDTNATWIARFEGYNVPVVNVNFGQDSSFAGATTAQGNTDGNGIGDFYYTPPTGYLALCTANLSDPAVIPSENFNIVLWSGNGSSRTISGVGFQPDFVWLKQRTSTEQHYAYDVIRGAGSYLHPNLTTAEASSTSRLTGFTSDGFSLSTDPAVNGSSHTYVSWNWKANGSGVSNTNGSITSTVSANQDAGFSIVTYTGTGNHETVGHGLGAVPDMVIVKRRNGTAHWAVMHKKLSSNYNVALNDSSGQFHFPSQTSGGGLHGQDTPTHFNANTFSLGGGTVNRDNVGGNGMTYVGYVFRSIDGFSKVGTYTGNGSFDGTFIYTGFNPRFIMMKRIDSSNRWVMMDSERDNPNEAFKHLWASESYAEVSNDGATQGYDIDFLSNGFKQRNDNASTVSDTNKSGGTYIYIAFAEHPFKYTNAR